MNADPLSKIFLLSGGIILLMWCVSKYHALRKKIKEEAKLQGDVIRDTIPQ